MSLRNLIDILARRRGGALVLDGLSAVLVGVERLMSPSKNFRQVPQRGDTKFVTADVARRAITTVPAEQPATSFEVAPLRVPHKLRDRGERVDYFTIRQTRSEVGYSYWVLQGHGVFASFELFDTWAEAIAAVERRLSHAEIPVANFA